MSSNRRICTAAIVILFAVLALTIPSTVLAGIYDAEDEVTYKEYWVPHEKWPSYALEDPDCNALYREWFIEATRRCEASTTFEFPDDVSTALRAEINGTGELDYSNLLLDRMDEASSIEPTSVWTGAARPTSAPSIWLTSTRGPIPLRCRPPAPTTPTTSRSGSTMTTAIPSRPDQVRM